MKKLCNSDVVFNKLILFTAEAYLTKSIDDGLSNEDLHRRIIGGIRAYMVMGRFSGREAAILQSIGEDEYMQDLRAREISFVVYALELLRLWVELVPKEKRKNIHIGVSDKILRKGRATFAVSMLNLKKKDEAKYKELRQIIDESVLVAKNFFYYTQEKINERCKKNT